MNEDYIKGMKILLRISHKQRINIRKYTWIPHVSKMLSEYNLCEKFWANVQEQGAIYKIKNLQPLDAHRETNLTIGRLIDSLLIWTGTKEGECFWYDVYIKYLKKPIF